MQAVVRLLASGALLGCLAGGALGQDMKLSLPGSPLGIAWGFIYGGGGVPAESFMPQVRSLGAGASKVYLFWSQLEPTKGHYDWSALDAYLKQLKSPDEGLISVFASSPWATRTTSLLLPPSPAKDPADYARFIGDLVRHCHGRVRYFENDAEPSNPIYWLGTKEEFVTELKAFSKAVRETDPKAKVVAGGYDGLFNPPPMPPVPNQQIGLAFFDYVLQNAGDSFDFFDLRLYGNPYTIPGRVDYIHKRMAAFGYQKPILCNEYGGPGFFEFPINRKYFALVNSWSQAIQKPGANGEVGQEASSGNGVADLYKKMDTLDPQTQMFLQNPPPAIQAKFERLQARDVVMRNVLAFSAGVQRTLYWDLWGDGMAKDSIMSLMFGKVAMMGYEGKKLTVCKPVAEAYARMAGELRGVRSVKRIEVADQPSIYLFEVDRGRRGPLFVVWEQRDTFTGEDAPAKPFEWTWASSKAKAVDALGVSVPVEVSGGKAKLAVSITPIFVEPAR
ncbi:hypothetical protein BH11ARM2_BH11ARM2_25360 [soil metagenome]